MVVRAKMETLSHWQKQTTKKIQPGDILRLREKKSLRETKGNLGESLPPNLQIEETVLSRYLSFFI